MAAPEVRPRGARLPRSARRTQLLGAAREVFVAQGYHAAAMDEIAERAGVSKPVLYQHFPSKRDLYLALLEQHTDELVEATRLALASTTDNKQRVAAAMEAFYAFIDSESESFRLVFESDFTNDPEVRELLERMQRGCAEAIAGVIEEDTGLPAIQAHLLAVGLTGISHVTARWWIQAGRPVPRDVAAALVAHLSWRGIGGFPKAEARADGKTEGKVDGKAGPA
jgi:AcrR family transcriptional regulator